MIKTAKKYNYFLLRIENLALNIMDRIVRIFTRNQFCVMKNVYITEGTMKIKYEPKGSGLYIGGSRE